MSLLHQVRLLNLSRNVISQINIKSIRNKIGQFYDILKLSKVVSKGVYDECKIKLVTIFWPLNLFQQKPL